MATGRFRVAVNGFRVNAETWDDALEWDGKRDEVFIAAAVSVIDKNAKEQYANQPQSPVMGDTNNLPGRVLAGTASTLGGLRTGDSFPNGTPWARSTPLDPGRDWPPFAIWEGDLTTGENVALVTPTIWEWDPGGNAFDGWLRWAKQQVDKVGAQVGTLLGPTGKTVVDAIGLGLGVAVSMTDVGGPLGSSGSRPIGMQADPNDTSGTAFRFNPQVLVLSYEKADLIVNSEPAGRGKGILSLTFPEAPYFRGNYQLFVQVERVSGDNVPAAWEPLGGAFTSGPAISSSGVNQLEVFGRGTDMRLYWNRFDGNAWSGWQQVAWQEIGSDPSAAARADGIDLAVRGTDNVAYYNRFEAGGWQGWYPLGGVLTSSPAIASEASSINVFGRGTDNALWWCSRDEGGWEPWRQVPGGNPVASDPAAVGSGDGRVELAVLGTDARIYHRRYQASTWSPWVPVGDRTFDSGPAIAAAGAGDIDLFARGGEGKLYWGHWDGTAWAPWRDLGPNPIASDPAAVALGPGRVDVVARGTDVAMYHRWYDGAWHP